MSVCKVTVFNLEKYVSEVSNGDLKINQEYGIIQNDDQAIFTDNDGVHSIMTLNESFGLPLYEDMKDESKIAILPSREMVVTISKLMDNKGQFETREMELTDFIRHFGSRLESNYSILLNSIKEIGLDPEDFPRKDKRG